MNGLVLMPIERESQFAVLHDLLARAAQGEGGMVVIRGPVACGKTFLLDAFAESAGRQGARVLTATASAAERARPLAVAQELFAAVDSPCRPRRLAEIDEILAEAAASGWVPSAAYRLLSSAMFELAEDPQPLVICVDDVHHADTASLDCLVRLARKLRSRRMLLVITESVLPMPGGPAGSTELVHRPDHHTIIDLLHRPDHHTLSLGPLSSKGATELVRRRLGERTALLLEPAVHDLTGGNPLLVAGLIEDSYAEPDPGEPVVGAHYGRAVLACLQRADRATRRVAEAIAVLERTMSDELISRLLNLYRESVTQARGALSAAGLIDETGFRHPQARIAVLEAMPAGDRAELHHRAAELLYGEGASALDIARHLSASGSLSAPWAMSILREATDQAVTGHRIDTLRDSLRDALHMSVDERQRAEIISMLASSEWHIAPEMTFRRVANLNEAILNGNLRGDCAAQAVLYLLWCGKLNEAVTALKHLMKGRSVADLDGPLLTAWMWVAVIDPGGLDVPKEFTTPAAALTDPRIQIVSSLNSWLTDEMDEGTAVGIAQQILHTAALDHAALASVLTALAILISADRAEEAAPLCDALLANAGHESSPTSNGLLCAARAAISIRMGDLESAERYATAALSHMSPRSWGIGIGAPLSVLVLAATAAKRFDEAQAYLSTPVPDAMFRTLIGLPYLYARGRFHLATERYTAALNDFQVCAELMTQWGIDRATFLPWRTTLAEAYVGLGQAERARDLASEQLTRLDPSHARARGRTLRLLAAANQSEERRALLLEAVETLRGSGDKLELARAFADLGQAHKAAGESRASQAAARNVEALAAQIGAPALTRSLEPELVVNSTEDQVVIFVPGDAGEPVTLSQAQWRVARLAALGHTNREIAGTLFVTISTVEQHLTRVYRKLKVRRRTDLPAWLSSEAVGSA